MQPTSKFQTKLLSRINELSDYKVYKAALEWDLTDPIVIESVADVKSAARWQRTLTPYHHQVTNLITFCRRLPVTLLADDVGLGKTISAGLIMSELIARARLLKILIVCPKVLCNQWQQELKAKFNIDSEIAIGKQLLTADPGEIGAVLTTYNSARLYLPRLSEDRFQMLVLDEAHKLRNLHGVPEPPQVAKTFRSALEARRFRFVLMLTATPIQNRLWDLYSLVDLLTVARGHENPFGTPGMFARRFIDDDREKARQLKPAAKDEFRSIIYGYMSRVRRGDAQLSFPDRVVQMHKVLPTAAEIQLIRAIAQPIQKMNKLAQISILQALVSSPHALSAQLTNMARKGTAPPDLATTVQGIVASMPSSAKLAGLEVLIEQLKRQNPDSWRLVVFTTRRETQTTIVGFLERHGLSVGVINGESSGRNQETIDRFRQTRPRYRVIVSTEAGSEGVNLQVANVLVNYDLPWNPMIVEQRVGRVQRLGSDFAHVSIFNITLQGTFEEYIVGRLMEKLQMATHAIGDIESLLQSSDVGDGDEDAASSFEDHILGLVLSALAGKNVEEDVRLKERSIENAKIELERAQETIDTTLGGMNGIGYVGPRSPSLPPPGRSMDLPSFTLAAFRDLGADVAEQGNGIYLVNECGARERITFDERPANPAIAYTAQAPAFQRLVKRMVASGLHEVRDLDRLPGPAAQCLAAEWAESFGAKLTRLRTAAVTRGFDGIALLRVRATTAHDSYERLVACPCRRADHNQRSEGDQGLAPVENLVRDVAALGIDRRQLEAGGQADEAIAEFCRFYLERGDLEMQSAGDDERKRKKLEDDFTPRLDISVVGLEGTVFRDVEVVADYAFDGRGNYQSQLRIRPSIESFIDPPAMKECAATRESVPSNCLDCCEGSGSRVLKHLLAKSEISGRQALPLHMATCEFSGKRVLRDELAKSDATGRMIAAALMKTSAASGLRAEPSHFAACGFTGADVLQTELRQSEISRKPYRVDQQGRSEISDRLGHASEFTRCAITTQMIANAEAGQCEATGRRVRPDALATCEVTGRRVLPELLSTCSATGKRVTADLLVKSSLSGAPVLRDLAVQSKAGLFCLPAEAQPCFWSNQTAHPDDLRTCLLTGLAFHVDYAAPQLPPRLKPLAEILDGMRRTSDREDDWIEVAQRVSRAARGAKCRIEAGVLSPSKNYLAVCSEAKTLLGFRVHHIGAIYDLAERAVIGRLAEGKRSSKGWDAR